MTRGLLPTQAWFTGTRVRLSSRDLVAIGRHLRGSSAARIAVEKRRAKAAFGRCGRGRKWCNGYPALDERCECPLLGSQVLRLADGEAFTGVGRQRRVWIRGRGGAGSR